MIRKTTTTNEPPPRIAKVDSVWSIAQQQLRRVVYTAPERPFFLRDRVYYCNIYRCVFGITYYRFFRQARGSSAAVSITRTSYFAFHTRDAGSAARETRKRYTHKSAFFFSCARITYLKLLRFGINLKPVQIFQKNCFKINYT